MTTFISFARRRNGDTTIDSICTRCYQTVASAHTAGDLEAYEQVHRCEPDVEPNYLHTGMSAPETHGSAGSMGSGNVFSAFLSTLDSIQNAFRSKIAGRQHEDRASVGDRDGEMADHTPGATETSASERLQANSQLETA
jgi:hypothetical protein